jgi:hypothetical protein
MPLSLTAGETDMATSWKTNTNIPGDCQAIISP